MYSFQLAQFGTVADIKAAIVNKEVERFVSGQGVNPASVIGNYEHAIIRLSGSSAVLRDSVPARFLQMKAGKVPG